MSDDNKKVIPSTCSASKKSSTDRAKQTSSEPEFWFLKKGMNGKGPFGGLNVEAIHNHSIHSDPRNNFDEFREEPQRTDWFKAIVSDHGFHID